MQKKTELLLRTDKEGYKKPFFNLLKNVMKTFDFLYNSIII